MTASGTSLLDFAVANQSEKKPSCKVCDLPPEVVDQIHSNERGGRRVSRGVILRWLLTEHGTSISENTLMRHLQKHLVVA